MSLQGDTEPSREEQIGAAQEIGRKERNKAGGISRREYKQAKAERQENNMAGTQVEEGNRGREKEELEESDPINDAERLYFPQHLQRHADISFFLLNLF